MVDKGCRADSIILISFFPHFNGVSLIKSFFSKERFVCAKLEDEIGISFMPLYGVTISLTVISACIPFH